MDPILPCAGTNLVGGKIDAMVEIGHQKYPLLLKYLNHHYATTMDQIISSKPNYGIRKDEEGNYGLDKASPLWYRCQSIMALYKTPEMILLCFCPKNFQILPVKVLYEPETFNALFTELVQALDIFDIVSDDMT